MEDINIKLGLEIEKISRFKEAMTHSSYEGKINNKKLAFLGDVILELAVSLHTLQKFPHLNVGKMTEKRATIVNAQFLSDIAKKWGLNKFLRLGKGERQSGGEEKESILSETVEALLGAVYLNYGYEKTERFIQRNIIPERIETEDWNVKGRLQELVLSKGLRLPEYSLIQDEIPEDNRLFKVKVKINGEIHGIGEGRNKKEAEEEAARNALKAIEKAQKG
ncbi:ribonuclease III [candidate division WOR-3 bacterium]|nr:ribonuclease III [candidate division WOR-3 bacterium]